MKGYFIIIIQFILFINDTKQSRIKCSMITLKSIGKTLKNPLIKRFGNTIKKPIIKTIGNPIKNSVGMFSRTKNTIKNFVHGLDRKYLRTRNNFERKSVKYLGEEQIKKCKYRVPYALRESTRLVRTESKKNMYVRSAAQLREKALGPMIKRSTEQMKGKELRSLINMIHKGKPQLPLLFAAGGFQRITQFNLTPENTENLSSSGIRLPSHFNNGAKPAEHVAPVEDEPKPVALDTSDEGIDIENVDEIIQKAQGLDIKLPSHFKTGKNFADPVSPDTGGAPDKPDESIKSTEMTADGEITIEPLSGEHETTLIFLHGLGGSAISFGPLFGDDLLSPLSTKTKIRLISAPEVQISEDGEKQRSWYDVRNGNKLINPEIYDMNDAKRVSLQIIEVIKEEVKNLGGKSKNVYLGGYNQGAAMALHVGLEYKQPLGAIIGMSGFRFMETSEHKANKKTPVFLSHGIDDKITHFETAKKTYQLNNWIQKDNVKFHEIDNYGQAIDVPTLDLLRTFLTDLPNKE